MSCSIGALQLLGCQWNLSHTVMALAGYSASAVWPGAGACGHPVDSMPMACMRCCSCLQTQVEGLLLFVKMCWVP
jgi:hypothetical protein